MEREEENLCMREDVCKREREKERKRDFVREDIRGVFVRKRGTKSELECV